MSNTARGWVGVLQVALAAFLWGTSGTFAKYLFNNEMSPYDLAQARALLSFALITLILAVFNRKQLTLAKADLGYFAIFGIVGLGAVQLTYLMAISLTNVATAIFLEYLAPALVLIYGFMTRTERFSWSKIIALSAALGGGYLIVRGQGTGLGISLPGLAMGLGAALSWAFYTVYAQYGLRKYSPWAVLNWGMGFASLAWFLYQAPWILFIRYDLTAWLQFLYIAVFATVLPFGLYFKGIKKLGPFQANLISSLEPVVGAVSAFIILGEILNVVQVFGSALVLVAVLLIQTTKKQQKKAG
ncbi:DMT family transporter [Paradesulfitobacterium aromaticivorans]